VHSIFKKLNIEYTLQVHLKKAIREFKPSVIAFFTRQKRDWFERLFLSSRAAGVSFDTKKQLLIFRQKMKCRFRQFRQIPRALSFSRFVSVKGLLLQIGAF
jgi:hypothetical protein